MDRQSSDRCAYCVSNRLIRAQPIFTAETKDCPSAPSCLPPLPTTKFRRAGNYTVPDNAGTSPRKSDNAHACSRAARIRRRTPDTPECTHAAARARSRSASPSAAPTTPPLPRRHPHNPNPSEYTAASSPRALPPNTSPHTPDTPAHTALTLRAPARSAPPAVHPPEDACVTWNR